MSISLIKAKNGLFREYGYVINMPLHFYIDKNEINQFARTIYQKLADDYGLPVITLDGAFEPEHPLDMNIINGTKNNVYAKMQDSELYAALRDGPKTISDLQKVLDKSQPTLCMRLKRMAAAGYIEKQNDHWLIPQSRLRILKMIEEL